VSVHHRLRLLASPMRTSSPRPLVRREISRFPSRVCLHMPGSSTTPGPPGARAGAPVSVAFRDLKRVDTRRSTCFAAQWLACAPPCRRFAHILADVNARLGAEVGRYAFLVMDLHHLLPAGLPAHSDQVKTFTHHPDAARLAVLVLDAIEKT